MRPIFPVILVPVTLQINFSGVRDLEYNLGPDKVKPMLPVKTARGNIVARFASLESKEAVVDEPELESESRDDGPKFASVAEMYSERVRLLGVYKERIASIASQLLQNPEEKVTFLARRRIKSGREELYCV